MLSCEAAPVCTTAFALRYSISVASVAPLVRYRTPPGFTSTFEVKLLPVPDSCSEKTTLNT
jgi:hypothetical protein